jgi:hypothetical protein
MHTRWCGREVNFAINTSKLLDKENYTGIASKFDVTYWRNWNNNEADLLPEASGQEAIAFYYGAEK